MTSKRKAKKAGFLKAIGNPIQITDSDKAGIKGIFGIFGMIAQIGQIQKIVFNQQDDQVVPPIEDVEAEILSSKINDHDGKRGN